MADPAEAAGDRRFPCLDGHTYSGCIGPASCWAERCWNGRRLTTAGGEVVADAFDRPPRVLRYMGSNCANCLHAVDLHVGGGMRSAGPGGRLVKRWTVCELGHWTGPASLYNLLNHRAPIKHVGRCPSFEKTPPEHMRPELARQKATDQARANARRARLRKGSHQPAEAPAADAPNSRPAALLRERPPRRRQAAAPARRSRTRTSPTPAPPSAPR
jgi:hypothetical protein